MKPRIAPDSILATRDWTGRLRYVPLLSLGWLFWLFGPAVFDQARPLAAWLWPTLATLPVFLALYWQCYAGPRRRIVWCALAVAALGYALTPVNPFGEVYAIYACALVACQGRMRQTLGWMLLILGVYGIEWFVLDYPWPWLLNGVLIGLVAGLSSAYQVFQRQRHAALRLSQDEVRRLAARAERERIGRDLHDLLGHTLSMVALKSELAGRLVERDPAAARNEIDDVARVAREALAQVRSAVSGIRAAALVSELASARLLLETAGVQMEYWTDADRLPADIETCLALVLREAVTNIERHARANRVEATVVAGAERVVMRIRDDGRGGVNAGGNGLTGMRERIAACGGELLIESPRGRGTSIEVTMPLPDAPLGHDDVKPASGVVVPLARPIGGRA